MKIVTRHSNVLELSLHTELEKRVMSDADTADQTSVTVSHSVIDTALTDTCLSSCSTHLATGSNDVPCQRCHRVTVSRLLQWPTELLTEYLTEYLMSY